MRGHGDVILLVGRGRDGIDARRIGLLLVFRNERGRRHLRDHETGVQARLGRQEGRHAGQRRIDQHGDAPLRQRADLADGKRDHVSGKRHRLGVEIPARQRGVVLGEDQRIVGDAIGFGLQRVGRLAQHVERRAHDLRLTAQAIRVLHTLVADAVRFTDCAAGHEIAQGVRRLDLAAMLSKQMYARIEGRVGTFGGVRRQRAGDQRRLIERLGLEQAGERESGRELRAVEQRQALLGAERHRLQPMRDEGDLGRDAAMRREAFADADHDGGHVRERRQVAGSTDRALRRHHRNDVVDEHRLEQFDRLGAHAGSALRQARELQRHHQPHDGDRHRLADAGGVRKHDVALEGFEIGGRNADTRQFAEAGVDAIDRLALGHDAGHGLGAGLDLRPAGIVQLRHGAAIDGAPVGERRVAGLQGQFGHCPLQIRAWSGLKPMR